MRRPSLETQMKTPATTQPWKGVRYLKPGQKGYKELREAGRRGRKESRRLEALKSKSK